MEVDGHGKARDAVGRRREVADRHLSAAAPGRNVGKQLGMGPFMGAFERGTFIVGAISSSPDAIQARYMVCRGQGLELPA